MTKAIGKAVVVTALLSALIANCIVELVTFNYNVKQKPSITFNDLNSIVKQEITCLARNVYFEARGETDEGKMAVAKATLNRVGVRQWSDTICGVVEQKRTIPRTGITTCQFSWVCDSSLRNRVVDDALYQKCRDIALAVYINHTPGSDDLINGAQFYHADYVNPQWKNVEFVRKIDRHLYYKANLL